MDRHTQVEGDTDPRARGATGVGTPRPPVIGRAGGFPDQVSAGDGEGGGCGPTQGCEGRRTELMSLCVHVACACPRLSLSECLFVRGSCIPEGPFGGVGPRGDATPVSPCSSGMSGNICLALLVPFSRVGLRSSKPQRARFSWPSLAGAPESLRVSWDPCSPESLTPGDRASVSPRTKRPLRSWAPGCPLGLCPSGFAVPKLLGRKWLGRVGKGSWGPLALPPVLLALERCPCCLGECPAAPWVPSGNLSPSLSLASPTSPPSRCAWRPLRPSCGRLSGPPPPVRVSLFWVSSSCIFLCGFSSCVCIYLCRHPSASQKTVRFGVPESQKPGPGSQL